MPLRMFLRIYHILFPGGLCEEKENCRTDADCEPSPWPIICKYGQCQQPGEDGVKYCGPSTMYLFQKCVELMDRMDILLVRGVTGRIART